EESNVAATENTNEKTKERGKKPADGKKEEMKEEEDKDDQLLRTGAQTSKAAAELNGEKETRTRFVREKEKNTSQRIKKKETEKKEGKSAPTSATVPEQVEESKEHDEATEATKSPSTLVRLLSLEIVFLSRHHALPFDPFSPNATRLYQLLFFLL